MTPESVMMMGTEAMKIALAVAAPLLLVVLIKTVRDINRVRTPSKALPSAIP
jgi:hypothetical protein